MAAAKRTMDELLGLTAARRQEIALRKALEARREAWPHAGYLYRGAGDYLLRHGRFFEGEELPAKYAHLRGPEGRCFENALAACEAAPELRYFEGVYDIGASKYTPHAWCVTADDRLCEVTFPTDPDELAHSSEHRTGLPILACGRWGYWGVRFDPRFVRAYLLAHHRGEVGMFDRPTGDPVADRREHWPLYTYPYDVRRSKPIPTTWEGTEP